MSSYTNVILSLVTAESNDPLILWLKNHKLLSSSIDCEHCSNPMSWTKNSKLGDGYNWRCINRKCTKKKGATTTIQKGSIFENSRLSLKMYFHVLYLWSTHVSETHIRDLTMWSASPHWSTCSSSSVEWKAYQKIQSELGFEHHTVNHSKRFVAPDGTHTQNIESYWNRIKQLIKRMNGCHRDFLHWYLQEFMYRERFNEGNFFLNFVEHISLFYRV